MSLTTALEVVVTPTESLELIQVRVGSTQVQERAAQVQVRVAEVQVGSAQVQVRAAQVQVASGRRMPYPLHRMFC
jgi:hypothetical protein